MFLFFFLLQNIINQASKKNSYESIRQNQKIIIEDGLDSTTTTIQFNL